MPDQGEGDDAMFQRAMSNALGQQPKTVPYPDYDPVKGTEKDFTLWLKGYEGKIKISYG